MTELKRDTKEFYEIMDVFEKTARKLLRFGSQGLKRTSNEDIMNGSKSYYDDGIANNAFIVFLAGVSLGKSLYENN